MVARTTIASVESITLPNGVALSLIDQLEGASYRRALVAGWPQMAAWLQRVQGRPQAVRLLDAESAERLVERLKRPSDIDAVAQCDRRRVVQVACRRRRGMLDGDIPIGRGDVDEFLYWVRRGESYAVSWLAQLDAEDATEVMQWGATCLTDAGLDDLIEEMLTRDERERLIGALPIDEQVAESLGRTAKTIDVAIVKLIADGLPYEGFLHEGALVPIDADARVLLEKATDANSASMALYSGQCSETACVTLMQRCSMEERREIVAFAPTAKAANLLAPLLSGDDPGGWYRGFEDLEKLWESYEDLDERAWVQVLRFADYDEICRWLAGGYAHRPTKNDLRVILDTLAGGRVLVPLVELLRQLPGPVPRAGLLDQLERAAFKMEGVARSLLWGEGNRVRPAVRYVRRRLGTDKDAWRMFFGLLDEWEASLVSLCDVAVSIGSSDVVNQPAGPGVGSSTGVAVGPIGGEADLDPTSSASPRR